MFIKFEDISMTVVVGIIREFIGEEGTSSY